MMVWLNRKKVSTFLIAPLDAKVAGPLMSLLAPLTFLLILLRSGAGLFICQQLLPLFTSSSSVIAASLCLHHLFCLPPVPDTRRPCLLRTAYLAFFQGTLREFTRPSTPQHYYHLSRHRRLTTHHP